MTFLLFQAFLLMAASYFLGAFLGCWWRRTFYSLPDTTPVRATDAAVATAPVAAAPAPAVEPRRAEPIPVQPRIEYVAPGDGLPDSTRFERALSGRGAMGEATPQAPQDKAAVTSYVPVPTPPPKPVAPPAPAKPVEAAPQLAPQPPAPAPVQVSPAPVAPANPAAAARTDQAMSAAAAAAAAAMTAAAASPARAAPATAPPPRPEPPAAKPAEPAPPPAAPAAVRPPVPASQTGGMSGAVAPVATPPQDRQDLKLIRGIDDVTERTLQSQGIWRYADIARWSAADVAAANRLVSARDRIQRENWIEQAAMLSGGGLTDFARRRLRGERISSGPTAKAQPARVPPQTLSVPVAAAATAPRVATPSQQAGAAAAAVAAAAASASRGIAASERKPVVAAPARPPAPVATAAPSPAPVPVPVPAPAATAAPAAAPTASAATAPVPADLLQRIRGVDAAAERVLIASGVKSYRQIAGWTGADVARFDDLVGTPGRITRENWIEQAQILAGGSSTHYARQRDAGGSAPVAPPASPEAAAPRPPKLADAIREKQEREAPSSQPQRSDVSGLRSVRSEALKPSADGPRIGGTRASSIDDLKRIRGVGVLIEKKLNSLGVTSYDQIANWTAADIAGISEALDFRGRIERENWVEQARILSAGGHTEFSRRVDRGEI